MQTLADFVISTGEHVVYKCESSGRDEQPLFSY